MAFFGWIPDSRQLKQDKNVIQLIMVLMTFTTFPSCIVSQSYGDDYKKLFDDVFYTPSYDQDIVPQINRTSPVLIYPLFDLVAITIDDAAQTMHVNGIMGFVWQDYRLAWDPHKYDIPFVYKSSSDVWLPDIHLINTVSKRKVFNVEAARVMVFYDGSVNWPPGSVLSFSCNFDLSTYPFDAHVCKMKLGLFVREFVAAFSLEEWTHVQPRIDKESFYDVNEEWDLEKVALETEYVAEWDASSLIANFHIRRRPMFVILNIILPVVFLAFLNVLTFLIPVQSGQRISYAVTMLMSMAVFLSIISDRIPHSADNIPRVTIYLCVTLGLSVVTVIESIATEFLHGLKTARDEQIIQEEEKKNKNKSNSERHVNLEHLAPSVAPIVAPLGLEFVTDTFFGRECSSLGSPTSEDVAYNKYTSLCKYIDTASFTLFFAVWLILTIGVFLGGYY